MREIGWTPAASVDGLGSLQDTSWLELFWAYVHDTSALTACLHYHEWVWVQDDPTLDFGIPSFVTMLTWKRTFDAILRPRVAVPRSQRLTKGARFDCPGFHGRVQLHLGTLQGLFAQFALYPEALFIAGACI